MRPFSSEPAVCEIKRLWVRPQRRGAGGGRALMTAALSDARRLGFAEARSATVARAQASIALHEKLGFRPAPAYFAHPEPDAVFLTLTL